MLFARFTVGSTDEFEILDFVGLAELLRVTSSANTILTLIRSTGFWNKFVFGEEFVNEVTITTITTLIVVIAVQGVLDGEEDVFSLLFETG